MQRNLFLSLTIIARARSFPTTVEYDQCDVSARTDCGYMGIDQPACEQKGCCWKPAQGGEPWCFYKSGNAPSCPLAHRSSAAPFSEEEVATMRSLFLKNINIQGSGGVVASPDHDTPGGDYYFHWERDGALSMEALLMTASNVSEVLTELQAYATWVAKVQKMSDPHGQSILTEPKYLLPSGQVYPGPWCRPQNDGPALRGKTLIAFATALLARQTAAQSDYVKDILWPLIQTDLDYVESNWALAGCDLWEEIRSDDFFWNRYTARAALSLGSHFASQMGDTERASSYKGAANAVLDELDGHWNTAEKFIMESSSRQKDAAVITALNDGYLGDGVLAASSLEAAGTISALNALFCASFAINQQDTKQGTPGIMYGRYEGDNYAGGNPWILLTAALAQLLYRAATEVHTAAAVPTSEQLEAWVAALSLQGDAVPTTGEGLAKAMAGAGDGVLERLKQHVASEGYHLAEQIDRNSGQPMSAKDLTWSYATVLKAMHSRSTYAAAVAAPVELKRVGALRTHGWTAFNEWQAHSKM